MKKKYCTPIIKEVVFRAEEAVSACIFSPFWGRLDITREFDDDDWAEYGEGWVKKPVGLENLDLIRVPGHPDYIYTRARYEGPPNAS